MKRYSLVGLILLAASTVIAATSVSSKEKMKSDQRELLRNGTITHCGTPFGITNCTFTVGSRLKTCYTSNIESTGCETHLTTLNG